MAVPKEGSDTGDCQCAVQNGIRCLLPIQWAVLSQLRTDVCGNRFFDILLFSQTESFQNAVHLSANRGLSVDYPGDCIGACCACV